MALMLPLLTVMLFGSLESGYYFWSEHKVVKGVRDAARYAGRQSFGAIDCSAGTFTNSAITTSVKQIARSGFTDGDNPQVSGTDNPVVPGWTTANVTVTIDCPNTVSTGIYADLASGAPLVTVSAEVAYPALFNSFGFGSAQFRLKASAQAAVMGL